MVVLTGSKSSLGVSDPAKPLSPTVPGTGGQRQRGFYSEVLDSCFQELEVLMESAQCGAKSPDMQAKLSAPRQLMVDASQLPARKYQAPSVREFNPSRALEPKVLVPFKPAPGEVPRRIVIERQKRLFALQDLAQLLSDVGIDSSVPDPPNALPLELFDNTEYECRPYDEWLAMGEPTDAGTLYLPALFLKPPSQVRAALATTARARARIMRRTPRLLRPRRPRFRSRSRSLPFAPAAAG